MNFEHMKPFIRHVEQITAKSTRDLPQLLKSYDSCILYVRSGSVRLQADGEEFALSKGSVVMWRAGIEYMIDNVSGIYIIIHFDYTDANQITNSFRMMPEPPALFNEKKISDNIIFDDATEFNRIVYKNSANTLEEMFLGIYSEFRKSNRHLDIRTSARMILILTEIEAMGKKNIDVSGTDKTSEILDFIHSHYMENFTNQDIAARFSFHPQHLNKLIRARTGYSLHKYIIMRRISKACELLSTTKIPVAEIGYRIGFQNSNHFSRYFKEFMMMPPGMYRKKNRM